MEMGVHYDVLQIQGLQGTHKIDKIKHLFYALRQKDTNMILPYIVLKCTDRHIWDTEKRIYNVQNNYSNKRTLSISYSLGW